MATSPEPSKSILSEDPVLHCPTCYSTRFQLSRVRSEDRLQMLFLRYPVRCRKCNARVYAPRSYANYLRRIGQVSPKDAGKDKD